jgi:translation initiation factor IF-1
LHVGPGRLRRDRVKLDIFGDVVLVIQCQTSRQGRKTRVTYRVCVLAGR